MELYCLKLVCIDWHTLRDYCHMAVEVAKDDLSFQDRLLLIWKEVCVLAGAVLGSEPHVSCSTELSVSEWVLQLASGGSEATSLEELPLSVAKAMPLHGRLALLAWVDRLRQGEGSLLLLASRHLCLLRKEPYWLIGMSRPIILEPFLRRYESGCMFRQFMSKSDTCSFMPAWAFAYRKEFNPLHSWSGSGG